MRGLSANTTEFVIFTIVVGLVLALGMAAARWRRPASMDALDEWGLGGRAFGSGVTFFLLGGDIYTAYTFVAVPALVYGAGAPGFFAVAFTTIMFPLAFVTLPRMWSVAHVHGFVTPAEFVKVRFGSRGLSALVAITAIAGTMPYIALQLIGIEVVFEAMGMDGRVPLLVAFALLAASTFRSGLRAPALMAVVKDGFILVIVVATLFGLAGTGIGWSRIFRDAAAKFAGSPGSGGLLLAPSGQLDYITLALGSALALFLYPHVLTGVLATRNRATLKRTLRIMPVYTLGLAFIALFGFVAISAGIRPAGGDPNTVVPQVFHMLLGNWGAGVGYAAIGVGALVPAAIMSIAAANLFSRCVYREFIRPDASAAQEARVSKWASLTVKLGAVTAILLLAPQFSVDLQLMGGVVILQVLPAVVLGLYTAWFHRWALIAGLVSGLAGGIVMLYQIPGLSANGKAIVSRHFGGSSYPLSHLGLHAPVSVYAGLIALAANLLVAVVLTPLLRRLGAPDGPDGTEPWHYVADESDLTIQRMAELVDGRPPYAGRHASARMAGLARLPGQRARAEHESRGAFEPIQPVASQPDRPATPDSAPYRRG